MRTSRFSNEQIVQALRQAESVTPVADIRRKLNATETTFYRWKKRFLGLLLATRSATHSRRWDSFFVVCRVCARY